MARYVLLKDLLNELNKRKIDYSVDDKSTTNSDIDYQAYFTQEEIDKLPNQEFIAQLRKVEVEC